MISAWWTLAAFGAGVVVGFSLFVLSLVALDLKDKWHDSNKK
jgi:hypothetical protein